MDLTVKTPKEELIGTVDDLTIPEDVLYANNTFSLRALNETLERLSLINFWSLYQTQRARTQMQRFDIPFNDFQPIFRLTGEKTKDYYPRRYISYVEYPFVRPELRKKYRKSELYNTAMDQKTIASNPDIFRYNHLVFINGDYIFTTEIYPQETKTGIIIDVASNRNEHGLTYKDFVRYKQENPIVTVIMVPNFGFSTLSTNQYVLDKYQKRIPFERVDNSGAFTENTICMLNAEEGLARRFWSPKIFCNIEDESVDFQDNLGAGGKVYNMAFITLSTLYDVQSVTKECPYLQLHTKMPCPKEHLIIMIQGKDGNYRFGYNVEIKMYYPNIYEFSGIQDGETGLVFIIQDEDMVTQSEEYMNELSKYEEYIKMLPQYEDGSIPEIIKHYRPSSFIYSIDDYESSIYVPDTMNYKVQKLHKAIYENPLALVVYLDLLNLPIDKFFLDMEKLDLPSRVRRDSSREDTDHGVPVAHFKEDRYVFAMNRHLVDTRSYGFRIFIDGLFQLDNTYTILPGPNFYFIYIPVSKITPTTMIEIERYKLFTIEQHGRTDSLDKPILELDFSKDRQMIGYSREIYAVDLDTMMYIPKKHLRIDVLYKFAERGNKWTTIPDGRNIPLENKVRVYVTDERYLNKPLRAGIQRRMSMATGDVYHEKEIESNSDVVYWYTKGTIRNFGGNDRGNYRVFNNGRILLPIQYYINLSEKYGGEDFFRTGTELHEGDRFTIDHVPAQFRVVYYQHEIDVKNKKGYVDLDGKLALPISLKWYDIYLNGRRLHKKNIEIISPTRFYVQGVESRLHLMIVVKNRDTEIFHLPYHETSMEHPEPIDWNNTIIDDLMDAANGLKEVIDSTKDVIDPDNEFWNIATNVCININALIFFFEHFMYTFINANKQQITQEIKDAFPMLLLEHGVMPIDSNEGCVKNPSIGGYLIKPIDCNIQKGEDDMFTDPNVNYDGIGALQDRFAIRPLNTDNYEFGLREEFMIDPNTAEPAIVNKDGTITAINTLVRLNNHMMKFNSEIILYGMGRANIYNLTFDDEYKTKVYNENGENLITHDVPINEKVKTVCVSVDATFLTQIDDCKMLKVADVDPIVTVGWLAGDEEKSFSCKLSRLKDYAITEPNRPDIILKSITITEIPDFITQVFIHSILVAF